MNINEYYKQNEYKNVNILLNFSIFYAAIIVKYAVQSSKEEKSINEHFSRKRPFISLWIRANMSKSIKRIHADWRTNKQINVCAIRFDYLENDKLRIRSSITCIFSSISSWLYFRDRNAHVSFAGLFCKI